MMYHEIAAYEENVEKILMKNYTKIQCKIVDDKLRNFCKSPY